MEAGRYTTARSALLCLIVVPLAFGGSGRCPAQSGQSPRDQLQQYVTQLQANPSDDALRTKIIQLALTLDPKPAVPDQAAINAAKGKTIFASATSPDDMKAAAAAFAQASNEAPWVPDYYYNEGLALEKAKQFDDAIHALNFYLVAAPNAPDAADVRGKIEGIRYEKDSAARQTQQEQEQRAQQAQAQAEAATARLEGHYTCREQYNRHGGEDERTIDIRDGQVVAGDAVIQAVDDISQSNLGRNIQQFTATLNGLSFRAYKGDFTYDGEVSPDGASVAYRQTVGSDSPYPWVVLKRQQPGASPSADPLCN